MISREKQAAILKLLAGGNRNAKIGLAGLGRGRARSVVLGRHTGNELSRHSSHNAAPTMTRACHATGVAEARGVPIERVFQLLQVPLGIDLKPEHRKRYEEIRAKKVEKLRAEMLKERAQHDRRLRKREQDRSLRPAETAGGGGNDE